jgi:hypothetical protein
LLVEKNNFIVETGFYQSSISFGQNINMGGIQNAVNFSYKGPLIPLRFQRRINLVKNKLFISPSLGVSWMNVTKTRDLNHFNIISSNDTLHYKREASDINKNFILGEAGVKFEVFISMSFIIDFCTYYSIGFVKAFQINYSYFINSGSPSYGTLTSYGNNLQFFIGVKYRLISIERRLEKGKKISKNK